MKKGILLCGHGTRVAKGEKFFKDFAEKFKDKIEGYELAAGFLELSTPDLEHGVKELAEKGVEEIIAVPMFLFTGVHMEKDIPCVLYRCQEKYEVKIRMARYIGVCEKMIELAESLIRKAVPDEILNSPQDVALVVAGVGSSRMEANADIAKFTRLLQERFRFHFATNGFLSKMTFPSLEEALGNTKLLPYANIVVVPYFFFPGIYIQRAAKATKKAEESYPSKQVFTTELLASDDKLYEVLLYRMQEVLEGKEDFIKTIPQDVLDNYDGHHHHHYHDHHHHHDHACKEDKHTHKHKH